MVENEKNPTQLTEEDLFIVDQIFIACVAIYYHCMETRYIIIVKHQPHISV